MKKRKKKQSVQIPVQPKKEKPSAKNMLFIMRFLVGTSCLLYILPVFLLSHTGIFSGHDIQTHLIYVHIFSQAFSSGQMPVRWVDWLYPGYNQPLFTFYQPLFYYLFLFPHALGFSTSDGIKILCAFLWCFSGVGMFLFTKRHFGIVAGLLAGILYMFAPYHTVDIFVRAALPEFCALAGIPFLFYAIGSFAQSKNYYYCILITVSCAFVLISHPPTLFMFSLLLLGYIFYLFLTKPSLSFVISIAGSFFCSIGLSAFFIIPALSEQSLIQPTFLHLGNYDFHQHFVCVSQLFLPIWGYGVSIPGCSDQMSFQVGLFHWFVILISAGLVIWQWEKTSVLEKLLPLVFLGMFFISLVLTLSISRTVWESAPFLLYIQYPWRFLAVAIFTSSFLSGYAITFIKNRIYTWGVYCVAILLVLAMYASYLHPAVWLSDGDTAANQFAIEPELGYMPKGTLLLPEKQSLPTKQVELIQGNASVASFHLTETQKKYIFLAKIKTHLIFFTHYFPGWQGLVDGKLVAISHDNTANFIELTIPSGEHTVLLSLTDTPLQEGSTMITIVSLILLVTVSLGYVCHEKLYKRIWKKDC